MLVLDEPLRELRHWIAGRVGFAFGGRAVQRLIIRQRMRVRANHMSVNERWTFPLPRVFHRVVHRIVAGKEVTSVDFFDVQIWEGANELRDIAAGCLHLDGDRDRVAVVLDQVDRRQLQIRRGVQRLPELAFTGLSFTGRYQNHFVALKTLGDVQELGAKRRLRASDPLKELRSSW